MKQLKQRYRKNSIHQKSIHSTNSSMTRNVKSKKAKYLKSFIQGKTPISQANSRMGSRKNSTLSANSGHNKFNFSSVHQPSESNGVYSLKSNPLTSRNSTHATSYTNFNDTSNLSSRVTQAQLRGKATKYKKTGIKASKKLNDTQGKKKKLMSKLSKNSKSKASKLFNFPTGAPSANSFYTPRITLNNASKENIIPSQKLQHLNQLYEQ